MTASRRTAERRPPMSPNVILTLRLGTVRKRSESPMKEKMSGRNLSTSCLMLLSMPKWLTKLSEKM